VVGSCEYGNERLGSVKGGKFLEQLNECWLLKKDFMELLVTDVSHVSDTFVVLNMPTATLHGYVVTCARCCVGESLTSLVSCSLCEHLTYFVYFRN